MNKTLSKKLNLQRPDMIRYCNDHFFTDTCPTETYEGNFYGCPFYDMCRALDSKNEYGIKTNYPLDFIGAIE